jgi:NADH dehydrogenase
VPERFFLELESPATSSWPHVVVVGGGFAGLRVCRALNGAKVRVTLIDKRNFNLFAPLLYQVATGLVSRGDVAIPLRMLVGEQANLQILLGEVREIDPVERSIAFNGTHLRYDHLVLATGCSYRCQGQDCDMSRASFLVPFRRCKPATKHGSGQ